MRQAAWVGLLLSLAAVAGAQSGRCVVSASAAPVRAEGIAEKLGDIVLQCTGLPPASAYTGNLTIFLPIAVTNRITAAGLTTDLTISANDVPLPISGQVSGQNVIFSGLTFPIPADGAVALRISNLRAAVRQSGGGGFGSAITANISSTLALDRAQVIVGFPQTGLLATLASAGIACIGSTLPATPTFSNLIAARTAFSTTRVTEGFTNAFEVRGSGNDAGTRFLMRYSGFPAGTRIFAPDYVAGADAAQPTIGGDLGGAPNGGQWLSGSRTLLLARVQGADINGAGGAPPQLPAGAPTFNSVSEAPLQNGIYWLVYEVVDANANAGQSAQIPVFYGIPGGAGGTIADETLSFAPVSNTFSASASAQLPRFDGIEPGQDCTSLTDCPLVQPQLSITQNPAVFAFTATAGAAANEQPGYLAVQNTGSGAMVWTPSVQYAGTASGWITLDPNTTFINNGSVRLFVSAKNLLAGRYTATVTIDAGPDGKQTFPVTLVVTGPLVQPPPPPVVKPVTISTVLNGATREPAPVVSGSLAIVTGTNFTGKQIAVTFDGAAAQIYSSTDTEAQVKVPDLGTKTSANVIVTVDGTASAPSYTPVAQAWPGIFNNGVLNQNNSVNGPTAGASAGDEIQIFATGLPASGAGVTVQIHDRKDLQPLYFGAVPQSATQQINVIVPRDLPPMSTYLTVCANVGAQQFCAPGAPFTIR